MRTLVAFASKRGGTAELASMIGQELGTAGLEVQVRPARNVSDLKGYDAVLVASCLYGHRWHPEARRFVARHAAALKTMPVWLVSSGPLDASAASRRLPPIRQVERLALLVGARGEVTFGGRLAPEARGVLAGAMARRHAGDWRDPDQIRAWVATVASELGARHRWRERNIAQREWEPPGP